MNEMEMKIRALAEDPAFLQQLSACTTPEEVAQLFTAADVEMTAAEAASLMTQAAPDGELSEEQLESVAGGWRMNIPIRMVIWDVIRRCMVIC